MRYEKLVALYAKLGSTTKRLEKTEILSEFLKKLGVDEMDGIIPLLKGRVFPDWDQRKVGFSSRLMIKAIAASFGCDSKAVEQKWSNVGDLGKVAEGLVGGKQQRTLMQRELTTEKVLFNIRKLAEMEGQGTVERKIQLVAELLSSASGQEARCIVNTILEELRVGIADGMIRDAISKAFNVPVEDVEYAFSIVVDYGLVARMAKEHTLGSVKLTPGKPTKVMLAVISESIEEAFEDLGKPLQFEYKLDGFRLLCHKKDNALTLFTRRMEEVTSQFPDVIGVLKKYVKGDSYVFDCEAVGIDVKTKKYLPFQKISQRIRRKYRIEEMAKKFPVELHVFDVLYFNGKVCLDLPQSERRKIVEKAIPEHPGVIKPTTCFVTSDPKEAQHFFSEALKHGTEGVMIKKIDAPYRFGRYVGGWLKLKQVLEPLDLVIIGADYGEGKRAGGLSSFVLACRSGNTFLGCGMVSTGVKEKEGEDGGVTYTALTKLLKPLILKQEGRHVEIKPAIVIEVAYEEIQKSPTYTSGYALRFPRFLRLRTDEKNAQDANTIADVERIYQLQKRQSTKK